MIPHRCFQTGDPRAEYETWIPLSKSSDVRIQDGALHFLNLEENNKRCYVVGQKRRRDSGFAEASAEMPSAKRQKMIQALF